MRAIKIDVVKQEVYYIDLKKDYRDIYEQIGNGCTTFCVPVSFDNNDSLFADDESLLRENDIVGGFYFMEWNTPIVGNAIIVGCDEEGESVDCLSELEEIKIQTRFLDTDICKRWADHATAQPRQVVFF
jgi:hypothetical protein